MLALPGKAHSRRWPAWFPRPIRQSKRTSDASHRRLFPAATPRLLLFRSDEVCCALQLLTGPRRIPQQ